MATGLAIHVVGGGPAGLYFALLMKQRAPACRITVLERDGPDDTFGWGIVLSERTLAILEAHDPDTHGAIVSAAERWEQVDTVHRGERVSVRGNAFSGIARLAFLQILHRRCRELGVDLRFGSPVAAPTDLAGGDLLVGADGAGSRVRETWSPFFQPSIELRQNRYIWLGAARRFDGLTMIFRETPAGLFIAHAYRFAPAASTFIVECPPETWLAAGLEAMSEAETCAYLARVFRDDLEGAPLRAGNFARWLNFPLVRNRRWWHRNVVLLGDAAHTAHFSIGSGTKLALEDAIALADAVDAHGAVAAALPAFQAARKPTVDRFQAAAGRSLAWLEEVEPYLALEPVPLTYKLMTRSGRVGYNLLKLRDPAFIARYDAWRGAQPAPASLLPTEFLDLFRKPTFAHLATLMPDGTPHVTPVWVDYDGQHILVNSAAGRQKDLNMGRRPEVAIEIPDPEDPNRYLHIRGPVVEITEAGADDHLDRLAQRYLGRPAYPEGWKFPGEVRRIYKIAPRKVTIWHPFG
ncbi:MAG: TIGR03618 family F420-dependent PPOX class oxidoreductase [Candidatus Rokubacteria bacterium]|nr:TIGR03618 family F420-dependent PPOX class oxidoreductase [Candidatus Rokubacteria bacterium]